MHSPLRREVEFVCAVVDFAYDFERAGALGGEFGFRLAREEVSVVEA